MEVFNEEIQIYEDGDGGPYGGNSPPFMLSKQLIRGNLNNVSCSTTFGDPTQFVLDRLREMALRTAVAAAAVADPDPLFGNANYVQDGLSRAEDWTQNVDLVGERRLAAYTINMPFLACAVACSLFAVVAIVPLYWQARSDSSVLRSFNPLEVAHVFDALLLQDVHEKDVETYVRKEPGLKSVRYSFKQSDNGNDGAAMRVISEDPKIAAVAT
jgi:hypothetical protein